MNNFMKSTLRLALLVFGSQLVTGCGGSSTNTAVVTTSSPAIFYAHSVAVHAGQVYAWGYNINGQLGIGNRDTKGTPVPVGGVDGYEGVAVGGTHTLAFRNVSGASVKSWGNNGYGELGYGTNANSTPADVLQASDAPLISVQAVAAGGQHSLALRRDGTVWSWGYNGYGQLGLGVTDNYRRRAYKIESLPAGIVIVKIAAGGWHSLALDSDGNVWAWGNNANGQLGAAGPLLTSLVPVKVNLPAGTKIEDIAAGGSHCLALDSQGNVWAWGYNIFGQLGVAPQANVLFSSTPEIVKLNGAAIQARKISAGLDHSLALGANGSVYSWGFNGYGQLGRGTVDQVPSAVPNPDPGIVPGIADTVSDIRAIGHHSLAFTDNGNVWAWGYNAYNQLGDDTTTSRSEPRRVIFP